MLNTIFDLIFDPGHGGRDSGAVGPTTYEKSNNLILAQKTAALLESTGRFRVHFTRTMDKDFCSGYWNEPEDLQNRVNLSKTMPGVAFVSFHNNSAGSKAYGNEVYATSPGGDGEKLARAIHARMATQLPDMIDRGVKFAGWYVCKYSDPPAALVEYGFINSEEATILAYMDQAALAIAQGIGDYFGIQVGGGEDVLEKAIVMFSSDDYWSAQDVDAKLGGGIALFNRNRKTEVPVDAMKAKCLYRIGGPATGHLNEVPLSGKDKYATAAAVGEWVNK